MKAHIKATGKIVEVKSKVITSMFSGENILKYIDQHTGVSYFEDELFFLKDLNQDTPDYWTHLEHQYAGMAMQGILASCEHYRILSSNQVTLDAYKYAHALIQKLKEKEEK
jgi:hypothetical protein